MMFSKKQMVSATFFVSLLLLSAAPPIARAHDGDDHSHGVRQVKPAEMYAPTPMPDRIILTWSGDPTTTQSVTWRTSTEVAVGKAELAVATAGPEMRNDAKSFDATSTALKTDINTAHFHSVTFKDLTPGTKYAYRVGDGTNWSEWFHFSTARVEQEPFSFIYFGDAQNDIRSMWSRVIREAYSDAPKAKFLLHAGDLINTAQSDAEWGEWFGAGHWLNAMIPNVPVVGNHEQHKVNELKRQVTHHWRPLLHL
jgi:phosphodiesterase/alkaline phosphatase D-like protein